MDCIEAKVVVLGAQGVGKTSLVMRYMGDGYNKAVSPTIGASFFTCKMCLNNQNIKLQVWDTAGQERFRAMAPMYYRNANAAIIVYDITRKRSFEDMKSWILELQKNIDSKIVMCIVGNKSDLSDIRQVPEPEAEEYAAHIGAKHFVTSALTNQGIEDVFLHISELIIKQLEHQHENNIDMYSNVAANDSVKLEEPIKTESSVKSKCCGGS